MGVTWSSPIGEAASPIGDSQKIKWQLDEIAHDVRT